MNLGGGAIEADFDFRKASGESWDIALESTEGGRLLPSCSGRELTLDGGTTQTAPSNSYPQLYRRFADFIQAGESDCDGTPLQLVADAFRLARRD